MNTRVPMYSTPSASKITLYNFIDEIFTMFATLISAIIMLHVVGRIRVVVCRRSFRHHRGTRGIQRRRQ